MGYRIVVTPAQRHVLMQLAHAPGRSIKGGAEGRRFRQFMRGFGLVPIRNEMIAHNAISEEQAQSAVGAVFTLSEDQRAYAVALLAEAERPPAWEMVLGDLADALEAAPAAADQVVANLPDNGTVPDYDPAAEDWTAETKERAAALEALDDAITPLDAGQLRQLAALADELAPAAAAPAPQKGADA
jgi:hypothetical protein